MVVGRRALMLGLWLAACAGPARATRVPDATLLAAERPARAVELSTLLRRARFTVIEFFSPGCACQKAHDARLVALARRFRASGVQFIAVDPESGATPESVAAEARARGYPFPLLLDRDARLADALGAAFATYVVLADENGRIYYRGGIDSDHTRLTPDPVPHLANAIEDVLAGRAPRTPEAKALGCALRTR